jgi:hypothetical protein
MATGVVLNNGTGEERNDKMTTVTEQGREKGTGKESDKGTREGNPPKEDTKPGPQPVHEMVNLFAVLPGLFVLLREVFSRISGGSGEPLWLKGERLLGFGVGGAVFLMGTVLMGLEARLWVRERKAGAAGGRQALWAWRLPPPVRRRTLYFHWVVLGSIFLLFCERGLARLWRYQSNILAIHVEKGFVLLAADFLLIGMLLAAVMFFPALRLRTKK